MVGRAHDKLIAEGLPALRHVRAARVALNHSDVIVYIERVRALPPTSPAGSCSPGAGGQRYLRIQVRGDTARERS